MSKVIRPTTGRKVWFWRSGADRAEFERLGGFNAETIPGVQPEDAAVTYVWSDRMVNLNVKDHVGIVRGETSVQLCQPEDPWNETTGAHCQWMPFQVSAAAK